MAAGMNISGYMWSAARPTAAGSWGGLVIHGQATVASDTAEHMSHLDHQIHMGGNSDADSSGVLQYVRVWHAGDKLGAGIILAGVGTSTTIDYCEAAYSAGSGFLLSGGLVDVRHLSAVFNALSGIAVENGYTGRGQYLFTLSPDNAPMSDWRYPTTGISIQSYHQLVYDYRSPDASPEAQAGRRQLSDDDQHVHPDALPTTVEQGSNAAAKSLRRLFFHSHHRHHPHHPHHPHSPHFHRKSLPIKPSRSLHTPYSVLTSCLLCLHRSSPSA